MSQLFLYIAQLIIPLVTTVAVPVLCVLLAVLLARFAEAAGLAWAHDHQVGTALHRDRGRLKGLAG